MRAAHCGGSGDTECDVTRPSAIVVGTSTIPHSGRSGTRLPDLPEWGIVEVPTTIAEGRVTSHAVSPLPPQCAALNRRYLDVCDLAVRAALERRRDYVYHAAMLDANAAATLSLDQIHAVVSELLDRHGLLL